MEAIPAPPLQLLLGILSIFWDKCCDVTRWHKTAVSGERKRRRGDQGGEGGEGGRQDGGGGGGVRSDRKEGTAEPTVFSHHTVN